MRTLHINVTNKVATFQARDGDIVCGNTDYQIAFTFDTEWDEHQEKTARFIWNGQYTDIPFTGNTCPVPMVRGASQLTVGVYAGELRTTTPAEIGCRPSVLCVGGEPVEADQRYISEAHRWADDAYTSAQVATDAEVKALNAQMWAEEAADQARQSADRAWSAAADAQSKAGEAVAELRAELSPRINRNTEDITILSKKVTNLEQGITPDPFVTDTTGIVPVNALPYAEVVKVGGMTYRDEATNTLKTAKPTSIESRGADGETVIDTLAIPEAVQALDGYGLGINADCYNHVDWEKKRFVQNVGKYTFSGAEAIKIGSRQTVNGLNVFIMNQHSIPYSLEKNTPILAESYDYKGTVDSTNRFYEKEYSNGSMYAYYSPNYGTMCLYFVSDIADVETFAQSITGMKMLYKFGEPIVTDIPDLLPEDNFIEVEGGGTIVAVNVENLEAPTEITYMTKEATV